MRIRDVQINIENGNITVAVWRDGNQCVSSLKEEVKDGLMIVVSDDDTIRSTDTNRLKKQKAETSTGCDLF